MGFWPPVRKKLLGIWVLGALLFLCATVGFAAPSKKSKPCPVHFGALTEVEMVKSPGASAVLAAIDQRFARIPAEWVEGKKRTPRLEKLYQDLLQLTPTERLNLRAKLEAAYPKIEDAPLLARIGLNEESGWLKFFEESAGQPTHQPLMIGELRPFVEQMPEATREKLLKEIGARYPTAGKVPEGAKNESRFFPKRLLDGWLRVLLKGDDTFRRELAEGKKPLAAYQTYLNEVRGKVFHESDKAARYAELSAKDLHGIAEEIQRFLREPATREHLYQTYRNENGVVDPPSIRLFGSTVKGTSRRGSDLDLGYGSLNPNFLNGGERLGVQVPGLRARLKAYLEKHHPNLDLQVEGKAHFVGTVDEILTALEPFMIEVKPDSIELLVFPREIEARKLPYRKGPAIYQAPAPTRYRLP